MPEFQDVYSQEHQGFAGDSGAFFKQGDNDMFRQQLIRIKTPRFVLRFDAQDPLRPLG
jgi:hypothetical protein